MESSERPICPDEVYAQFPEGAIKLKTRILPQNGDGAGCPVMLIEGDALSLQYFARLVLAQAAFPSDCGFEISPTGPGSKFFDNDSQVGIYIHRLP